MVGLHVKTAKRVNWMPSVARSTQSRSTYMTRWRRQCFRMLMLAVEVRYEGKALVARMP